MKKNTQVVKLKRTKMKIKMFYSPLQVWNEKQKIKSNPSHILLLFTYIHVNSKLDNMMKPFK
jgi:hypothetical protein